MIYFLTAQDVPVIKIGHSARPDLRWQSCMTWSPVRLYLAAVDERGDGLTEAELLRRFAPYRSHGEWFHASPPLLEAVAETARTGSVPSGWYIPPPFDNSGGLGRGPSVPQIMARFNLKLAEIRRIVGSTGVGPANSNYPFAAVHIPPLVKWLVERGHVEDYLGFFSAFPRVRVAA